MASLNLSSPWNSLARTAGGQWLTPPGLPFSGRVIDDSRAVGAGDLFVAIKGELTDGFRYVLPAAETGAGAVCVDRQPSPDLLSQLGRSGTGVLLVADTLAAYHALAQAHRFHLRAIPLIAVTGSSGKTSIRSMIQAVLDEAYPGAVVGTAGNTNNHFGVPRNVFRLADTTRAAVLELGTNHPGEIAALAAIVQPDVAVVGNVGQAHIEFFGSQENIAREKGSIFAALPATGTAVMPDGGAGGAILRELAGARAVLTFGAHGSAADIAFRYEGIKDSLYQVRLEQPEHRRQGDIAWSIGGRHQAANAAAATAACLAVGLDWETILRGLRKTALPGMRMDVRRIAGIAWYNDAYNANPESARASLDWFAEATGACTHGTRYAILGDMLEMGPEHAPGAHRSLLAEAAAVLPNAVLLGVGGEMTRAGKSCGVRTFADSATAAAWLRQEVKPGDCILLKGSRGTRLEKIMEALDATAGEAHPAGTD